MRLLFAGTPQVAVPALRALLASKHEVVAVLTRAPAPAGRGRRSTPSPVAEAAEAAGVPVLTPARVRDPEFLDRLRALAPDCAPVVAYGNLIPAVALDVPRLGWVNLHFSVLPAWRGAAPVQRAIMAGDTETGATVFRLDEGLDTGPVLATMVESLGPSETAGAVLERLARNGSELLVATLDALAASALPARPQPADGVSFAPKLSVADAEVTFATPAYAVDRIIRGCTPDPGPWTWWGADRVKLGPLQDHRASAHEASGHVSSGVGPPLAPGRVRVSRHGVDVGTTTSAVRLGDVQPPGKRMMAATDWARGAHGLDGATLGRSG